MSLTPLLKRLLEVRQFSTLKPQPLPCSAALSYLVSSKEDKKKAVFLGRLSPISREAAWLSLNSKNM